MIRMCPFQQGQVECDDWCALYRDAPEQCVFLSIANMLFSITRKEIKMKGKR